MQIDSISGLSSISSSLSVGSSSAGSGGSVGFSDVLNDALEQVIEAEEANQQSTNAVLSGEDEGLETTMISATKAELTLSLAIEIRNKVVDAYNEIMKMQM